MNSAATPTTCSTPATRRNARPTDSACSASPSGREPRVYNAHEALARSRKVLALVGAITSNWPGNERPTAEHVRALTVGDWKQIAEWCGIRKPSDETTAAVVRHFEMLDRRPSLAELAAHGRDLAARGIL